MGGRGSGHLSAGCSQAVNHPRSFQPITLKSPAGGCVIEDPPPAVIQLTDPLTVSGGQRRLQGQNAVGKRTGKLKLLFLTAHHI